MSLSVRDIAWLAGLLEGEGSFRKQVKTINIMVGMTDEDVIARASVMVGYKYLNVAPKKEGYKPQYHLTFSGRRAASWMMTVYPLMGARRKAKIMECLRHWLSRQKRFMENVVCGHLDKPLGAKGYCDKCYDKRRPKRKANLEVRRRWYAQNRDKHNSTQRAYVLRKKAAKAQKERLF